MHHGTCVTHLPWCMPGSLTRGFLWIRWRGKRSRHSRRIRNPLIFLSGKRSTGLLFSRFTYPTRIICMMFQDLSLVVRTAFGALGQTFAPLCWSTFDNGTQNKLVRWFCKVGFIKFRTDFHGISICMLMNLVMYNMYIHRRISACVIAFSPFEYLVNWFKYFSFSFPIHTLVTIRGWYMYLEKVLEVTA